MDLIGKVGVNGLDGLRSEDKWLFLYTLPCHGGNVGLFEYFKGSGDFGPYEFLKGQGDFGREAVRCYFAGVHNEEALRVRYFNHMLLEYVVFREVPMVRVYSDLSNLPGGVREVAVSMDKLDRAVGFGIVGANGLLDIGDRLFIHAGFIVDYEEGK